MLPLTKLVRSVSRGFGGEKMVQTVTWLTEWSQVCRKSLRSDSSMRVSMSNEVRKCKSAAHGLF